MFFAEYSQTGPEERYDREHKTNAGLRPAVQAKKMAYCEGFRKTFVNNIRRGRQQSNYDMVGVERCIIAKTDQ